MEQLINLIHKLLPEVEVIEAMLGPYFLHQELAKGEELLHLGQVCRSYFFVSKGLLRVYFLNDGEEYTSFFAFEDYFFTEIESFLSAKASNFSIVATEKSDILLIDRDNLSLLAEKYPFWNAFLLKIHEQTQLHLIEAIHSFQIASAKERYEQLFAYPRYLQRVKQKDLSTMLGITKHTLSRLRKK